MKLWLQKLQDKEKAKQKKAELLPYVKVSETFMPWVPASNAAEFAAAYKKHKQELEQAILWGSGTSANPSKVYWSNLNHTPAFSVSATSSANYTQVIPNPYWKSYEPIEPPMTIERAIALNDGKA